MSSIAFHSPQRTIRIHGPERAHAHILCQDLLLLALGVRQEFDVPSGRSGLRTLVFREEWCDRSDNFLHDFELHIRVDDRGAFLLPNGTGAVSYWHAALNTAIKLGPDPIRFLARVDAQCELHGYVEGQHRAWLADIVAQGLELNILRRVYDGSRYKDSEDEWWGWQRLIQMLREDDSAPVVMSHSSSMGFPDPWMMQAKLSDSEWYALSHTEQWESAMSTLREENKQQHLALDPDTLSDTYFGEVAVGGFDLRAMLDNEIAEQK